MGKIRKFLFLNGNIKQVVIKNTIWLFIGELGVRLLKLIIFIYAARKLGVTEWGMFSYMIAIMATVAILSDIGINSVLIKKVAGKEENNEYISTGFVLKIILSFISSIVLLSLVLFIKEDSPIKILIPLMSMVLFVDSLREFGFTLNRTFEKMELEAMSKIATTGLLVIISFIFIHYNQTAISLAYSYLISGVFGMIIMYFILRKYLKNSLSKFNKKLLLQIFKEAWPLALVGVFGIIMTNIDTIILGWYKDVDSVGIYSIAQKPIQIIYIIPSLLSTAFLPVFSKLYLINKEKMNNSINKALNFSLIFAIPTVVGSIILGDQLIISLFGQQYIEAINIFKIMTVIILVSAPGIILSNVLFIEGKQKEIAKSVIIGTIINLLLCILLIPRFGTFGAAIATTLCQIITNILIILSAKKIKTIKIQLDIMKIIIATIIITILVSIIKIYTPFFVTVIIAIIFYILSLFILKDKNIINLLKS